jgi:hypothetical protein
MRFEIFRVHVQLEMSQKQSTTSMCPCEKAPFKIKTSPCRLWYELVGPTGSPRLPHARKMRLSYFRPFASDFRTWECFESVPVGPKVRKCADGKSKLTKTLFDGKDAHYKCCIQQGHSGLFQFVLSDQESILDLRCPENSRKFRCAPARKVPIGIKMSQCRL